MDIRKLKETRRADLLSGLLRRVERLRSFDDKVDSVLNRIEVTTTRLERAGNKRPATPQDGQVPAKRVAANADSNPERVCAENGGNQQQQQTPPTPSPSQSEPVPAVIEGGEALLPPPRTPNPPPPNQLGSGTPSTLLKTNEPLTERERKVNRLRTRLEANPPPAPDPSLPEVVKQGLLQTPDTMERNARLVQIMAYTGHIQHIEAALKGRKYPSIQRRRDIWDWSPRIPRDPATLRALIAATKDKHPPAEVNHHGYGRTMADVEREEREETEYARRGLTPPWEEYFGSEHTLPDSEEEDDDEDENIEKPDAPLTLAQIRAKRQRDLLENPPPPPDPSLNERLRAGLLRTPDTLEENARLVQALSWAGGVDDIKLALKGRKYPSIQRKRDMYKWNPGISRDERTLRALVEATRDKHPSTEDDHHGYGRTIADVERERREDAEYRLRGETPPWELQSEALTRSRARTNEG